MGSEHPRKGERRLTADPLRHFPGIRTHRKSLSTTIGVAGGAGSGRVSKTALTPISRLKKFQKLRDRNLRKQVLDFNAQFKMLETVGPVSEAVTSTNNLESMKVVKKLGEEVLNGINGISEEKEEELGINGMEGKSNGVETNGESVHTREDTLHEAEEDTESVKQDQNGEHHVENQLHSTPPHEDRELEVEVKVVESRSSSKRSTPRRSPRNTLIEPASSMSSMPLPPSRSFDDAWRSDLLRISGRRPIHSEMTPPLKRKSDEYFNEPASKRQAITPSLPSPGWKFLSPFSLFHRRTPGPVAARPIDDSLFVNVSTDSEVDLDTSSQEEPSPSTSPSDKPSWLCSIM